MFQFRRFPPYTYFIQYTVTDSSSARLPHSDISGSKYMCYSPKLFAACHVLHRLLMPRHSLCALLRLTLFGPWFSIFFKNHAGISKKFISFRWLIVLPLIKKSPQLNFEFFIPLCCLTFVYHHNHFVQFSRCKLHIKMWIQTSDFIQRLGSAFLEETWWAHD